jgi:hypothetical protein
MVQIVLIGIAAGAASALLIASFASGSLLSVLLFYLAPLPIMIVALSWSHLAGLIAAGISSTALAAGFGPLFAAAHLAGIGLPAWWLSYLALLARRGNGPAGGDVEWYPVGRLVIWGALVGTLVGGIFVLLPDPATFRALLRRVLDLILRLEASGSASTDAPSLADIEQMLDLLVLAIPPTAAAISTLTNLGNLWLAGQVARVSGRLRRPWPTLSDMVFPRLTAVVLIAAIAGACLPALTGSSLLVARLSAVLGASLLMAYAMLGLAVLHATTRGLKGRGVVLAGTYATVAVLGWPVLVMTLVGLVDSAIDIRGRIANRRGTAPPGA